jgi:hypothetical protein
MTKGFLPGIFWISVLSFSVNAETPLRISVSPSLGYSFGETEYIMNLRTPMTDENGDVVTDDLGNPVLLQIKSQLEYPLDVTMGGGNFRLTPAEDPELWSVEASAFVTLNDPGGVMKDSDWDGANGLYELTQWSYTESSAEMSSLLLNFEATRRILSPGNVRVAALAGLRYHKIEQKLFGVDGWQRLFEASTFTYGEPIYFTAYENTQVLYYEIKYLLPQIGLNFTADLSPNFMAGIKTIFVPVWFEDVDDHLLRNKLSRADGTGTGFIGSLNLDYRLGSPQRRSRPFISIFAEFTSIGASGDQTQEWYGDDPASPDFDDTGSRITGIPHDANITLYRVGIKAGLTF